MTWNWKLIGGFLKSIVFGVVASTLFLGLFGLLLGGVPGMVNMAIWGMVLGLVGGAIGGLGIMMARYGQEIGGNYSRWRQEQEGRETDDRRR
jgi:hypothetical protein